MTCVSLTGYLFPASIKWFALVGCRGSTGEEFSAGVFHAFYRNGLFPWFLCGPIPMWEGVNYNLKTDT